MKRYLFLAVMFFWVFAVQAETPNIQGHLEVMAVDTQGRQYLGK